MPLLFNNSELDTVLSIAQLTVLGVFLLYLAIADFKTGRIRNRTLIILLILRVVFLIYELFEMNFSQWAHLQRFGVQFLVGVGLIITLTTLVSLTKTQFGGGDIKLLAVVALYLPVEITLLTIITSMVLQSVLGIIRHICYNDSLNKPFPFVPALFGGYIVTLSIALTVL